MVYTIEEISARITPIAKEYNIPAIYLFGSYARNQAAPDSDIDLLVDTTGTNLTSLFKLGALYSALEDALQKSIDLITVDSLSQPQQMQSSRDFRNVVLRERKVLYAVS